MSSGARLTGMLLALTALSLAALMQAQIPDRPPRVLVDPDVPAPLLGF
jgi:hypothetical protein